jgi:hypothetical protein
VPCTPFLSLHLIIGQVSSLNLFKSILAEERAFPKDQAYKDLKNVIEYIVKKFFKAARENPFVLVEVGLIETFALKILTSSLGFFPEEQRTLESLL